MLTEISLRNFKCFEKLNVTNLNKINVLTGGNNSGKSSILQAINFVKTSLMHGELVWEKDKLGFSLNSFIDTVYGQDENRVIEITFTFRLSVKEKEDLKKMTTDKKRLGIRIRTLGSLGAIKYKWLLDRKGLKSETVLTENNVEILGINHRGKEKRIRFSLSKFSSEPNKKLGWDVHFNFLRWSAREDSSSPGIHEIANYLKRIIKGNFDRIYYISPERKIHDWEANVGSEPHNVGIRGENTVPMLHYIFSNKGDIFKYIRKWIKKFDVDIKELISGLSKGTTSIKLKTKLMNANVLTMGFGLNQVFPIIVQCCDSPNDSVLLIEEPEIHIHPGMQKVLIDLFLEIVRDKKQIILTTHSLDILVYINHKFRAGMTRKDIIGYKVKKEENVSEINPLNLANPNWSSFSKDIQLLRDPPS